MLIAAQQLSVRPASPQIMFSTQLLLNANLSPAETVFFKPNNNAMMEILRVKMGVIAVWLRLTGPAIIRLFINLRSVPISVLFL